MNDKIENVNAGRNSNDLRPELCCIVLSGEWWGEVPFHFVFDATPKQYIHSRPPSAK